MPCTHFYTTIYLHLSNICYFHAHFGDWAKPTFWFRIVADFTRSKVESASNMQVTSFAKLCAAFGDNFTKPKEVPDLGNYNSDLSKGELAGHLCFLDNHSPVTISVCYFGNKLHLTFKKKKSMLFFKIITTLVQPC